MTSTHQFALAVPLFELALAYTPASSVGEDHAVLGAIESGFAQCLLRLERTHEAARHINVAQTAAQACGTFRAHLAVNLAVGLQLVYAGDTDKGLDTLETTLSTTAANRALHEDALRTCIAGYERAGRHERALELNRRLIRHVIDSRVSSLRWAIDTVAVADGVANRSPDERSSRGSLSDLGARTEALLLGPWRSDSASSPTAGAQDRSIRSRLRQLHELLDDGLITADEYAQRRCAILDEV